MAELTLEKSKQIAELINRRNKLTSKVKHSEIMLTGNYQFIERDDKVVAAIGAKRANWYQLDVFHLVVHEDFEGQGLATELVNLAIEVGKSKGLLIAQCTIVCTNTASIKVFSKSGFDHTLTVTNPKTGNQLLIMRKLINS